MSQLIVLVTSSLISMMLVACEKQAASKDKSDSDGDGLSDNDEEKYNTDPQKSDSDGDGVSDGQEISDETNPLDSSDYMDPADRLDNSNDTDSYNPTDTDLCGVRDTPVLDVAPGNNQAIIDILPGDYAPSGGTPLWKAMFKYLDLSYAPGLMNAAMGNKYLVIISDGGDGCGVENGASAGNEEFTAITSRLLEAGIDQRCYACSSADRFRCNEEGECSDLLSDHDHCGECDYACTGSTPACSLGVCSSLTELNSGVAVTLTAGTYTIHTSGLTTTFGRLTVESAGSTTTTLMVGTDSNTRTGYWVQFSTVGNDMIARLTLDAEATVTFGP